MWASKARTVNEGARRAFRQAQEGALGNRSAYKDSRPLLLLLEVPEAVVRWLRGREFAVENVLIAQHNHVRLQRYVNRVAREPERMSQ
jgi:hypothetical protein